MSGFKKAVIYLVMFMIAVPISQLSLAQPASAVVTESPLHKNLPAINKKQSTVNITQDGEILDKRTTFSKTYLKPNGDKELVTSLEPINYQVEENGKKVWRSIDSDITPTSLTDSDGGVTYRNRANAFKVDINENLFEKGVSISQNSAKISLRPQKSFSAENSKTNLFSSLPIQTPTKKINKNSIGNVDSNRAIEYTYKSINSGLKEEVKLNSYPGQNTFYFDLNLDGLTYKKDGQTYYFYQSGSAEPVFYIPPSLAYDSNRGQGDSVEDFITYNVETEIISKNGKYFVKLTVDDEWLKSKNRRYPVIIDPTIYGGLDRGYYQDSFVEQYYANTQTYTQDYLFAGWTAFYNNSVYVKDGWTRTLLPFSAPESLGDHVTVHNARVTAYQRLNNGNHGILARMTSGYDGRTITWNNQPGYSAETAYNQNACTNCWIDIDVTNLAKYWYESMDTNFARGYLAFMDDNDQMNGANPNAVFFREWLSTDTGSGPTLTIDYTDINANYSFSGIHDAKVGAPYSLSVNVQNTGTDWMYASRNQVELAFYRDGQYYDRYMLDLPGDVAPGAWATVSLNNFTIDDPGSYRVTADIYSNDYGWYSEWNIPVGGANFTIADYPEYGAIYQPVTVQPSAATSSTITVPINVQNNTRYNWPVNQYKLSYHWIDNSTGATVIKDGLQSSFDKEVAYRGGWGTGVLQVKAPFNAGSYKLKIDLLQNGVTWFSDKGVATKDYDINITPASFSGLTRLGDEDYYAKLGPVDLATGNLSYSSTDMTISSNTGLLSMERSYNANSLDQTYDSDSEGNIRSWLLNGPYRENDQTIRLSKKYISNEETIRPNEFTSSNGKLWFKTTADSSTLDINKSLDSVGAIQLGYANNSVVYAHTYVYSTVNQTASVWSGSDNASKIWVNGVMRYAKDYQVENYYSNDVFEINLNAGWNSILMKVTNASADYKLSFKIADWDGVPLTGLKYALNNQDIFGDYQTLGRGWTASFQERLYTVDDNNIYYRDSTGSVNQFTKKADGTYSRPTGTSLTLIKNADSSYSVQSRSGLKINFSSTGQLVSKKDLSNNTISYQYDTNGNCTKIVDGGRYLTLSYAGSQLSSIADQLGNKYLYSYDMTVFPARLTKVTDPLGNYFTYGYSSNGKLTTFTDKNGSVTQIGYDSNYRVNAIKDALGNQTSLNYRSGAVDITDALGRKSTGEFDQNNLLTAFTNAKNYRERYIHDGNYNILTIIPDLPENDYYFYNWSYSYDSNDNLLTTTDPMNQKMSFVYSGNDLIKQIDADGSVTQYTYSTDGRRLLLSATDPKLNVTSYGYDSAGRKTSITDPMGAITKYTYSTDGDALTATTPKGEVTTNTFDAIGRVIYTKTALAKTSYFTYNSLSLLTKITNPSGLITLLDYDKTGNKIKTTDPNGAVTAYIYDLLGQLVRTVDPTGAAVQYVYDAVGNKTKDIDANGKVTTYQYDNLNQLISQTDASGGIASVQYDRNSQPTQLTDPKGQVDAVTYDKDGSTTKTVDSEGTTALIYNKDGLVTGATSTVNSENMSIVYDANNNMTGFSSNVLGNVSAAYNKNDSPVTIQTPTVKASMTYDANGQVSQISTTVSSQTLTTKFTKDKEGKTTLATKPNGDTTAYSYDTSNRITAVINRNAGKALLSQFNYKYDKAFNIIATNETKTGVTTLYAYNARNELIKEGTKTYLYDPMGNRKTMADSTGTAIYTYDTAGDSNRLLSVAYPGGRAVSYQYDANGNITKQIDSILGTTSYDYDADDYFTKAILPNGNTITYTYNKILKLRTKRIETNVSGTILSTTNFIYDGDRLVSETDDTGKITKSYAWDENERLISVSIPDAAGTLRSFNYQKNLKEDVIGLTDSAGNLVAEYAYDAWGNITKSVTKSNSPIANLDKVNPRQYSSYWYDSSLGLYFMKTRLYNPQIGRFLSKDSITAGGSAIGYNPYIYCYNNPVNQIDPSGKFSAVAVLQWSGTAITGAAVAVGVEIVSGVLAVASVFVAAGVILFYPTHAGDLSDTSINETVSEVGNISITGGSVTPPGNGDNKDKNKKNTSRNYENNPNTRTETIKNVNPSNPTANVDKFTKPGLPHTLAQRPFIQEVKSIEKIGATYEAAKKLVERAQELGLRAEIHLESHTAHSGGKMYGVPHFRIDSMRHIPIIDLK